MKKHDHHQEELFMQRAMELAKRGISTVSPNPLVGCVIVHDHKIIGEGWHQQFGGPHAEVNAVNSVSDQSVLPESTLYVNLEPCSHTGKTPPCTDLILKHKIKKVVIANIDTNPLVGGTGIKKLREAGLEVITGILDKAGRELNKRFFVYMEKKRPFVLLKWAQTADGFIAHTNHDSKWISNEYSRQLVHKWRSEEDSVLVGTKTVFYDNPKLNVRDWTGRNPVRIVIDRFLKLPDKLYVFDQTQKTLLYNVLKHEEHKNLILIRVDEENFLEQLLHDMYQRGIQSVMVEGGAQTLQHFIGSGFWDEARIFHSKRSFGEGITAPLLRGNLLSQDSVINDTLLIIQPHHGKS